MTKNNRTNVRMLWESSARFINLNKQLAFLRENRRKIREDHELYFNERRDEKDINQYYHHVLHIENINDDVFQNYHQLVKITHKNHIPYFISKDLYLYPWVDLQPDGSVKNIYSGVEKDPQILIMKDYEIIKQKYDEFQQYLSKINKKEFELIKHLKKVEWKLRLNTEHIVPQSWFGGFEPMKGDLHHLFICQPECNIIRSNYPYDDFSIYVPESPNEPIKNYCGVSLNGKFEPEYGKGAVARAMLYFLLRYPNAIKRSFRSQVNIPLLIRWHKEFPVSLHERHRNQAIYHIQGNRNPFIDFPELVENIEFQARKNVGNLT